MIRCQIRIRPGSRECGKLSVEVLLTVEMTVGIEDPVGKKGLEFAGQEFPVAIEHWPVHLFTLALPFSSRQYTCPTGQTVPHRPCLVK